MCRPLNNDAGETPGVRQRLGYATALNTGLLLLPFKLRPLIYHSPLRLYRGRLRPRRHADWLRYYCVITTSPCGRPPPRLGLVKGVMGLGVNCAAIRLMEKMQHAQPVPRLRMVQRFAGAGSK